jgi:hypothetical protein
VEAYEALRFDEGLADLDAALAEAALTGAAGLSTAELSDLYLYRGLVYTQRGDLGRAWDDLVRAAVVDPARVLDPLRFPPRAVEAFHRATERVAAGPRGELVVQAPAGCDVAIDGAAAPARMATLPFGEHLVRVTCAARKPWATRATIAAAATTVTAAPQAEAPPSDGDLVELGRGRAAAAVALVVVSAAGGAPPSVTARVVDSASGRVRARASTGLAGGAAAVELLDRLLAPAAPPPRGRRWYQRGWVWGLAGAAAAGALLLPFALDGGEAGDVTLRPSGLSW